MCSDICGSTATEIGQELDEPMSKRPIKPLPVRGNRTGQEHEPLLTMAGHNQTPAELVATFPTKKSLAATVDRDGAWFMDSVEALQSQTNLYTKRLDALSGAYDRLEAEKSALEQEKAILEEEKQVTSAKISQLNKQVYDLHYKAKRAETHPTFTFTADSFAFQPSTPHTNPQPLFTSQNLQAKTAQDINVLEQQLAVKAAEFEDLQRKLNEACANLATEKQLWEQEKIAANLQYEQLMHSENLFRLQNSQLETRVSTLHAQCQANESLAQQLQQASSNAQTLTQEKDNAIAEAQNSQARIVNVNQKLESLAEQLQQATSNVETLTQEKEDAVAQARNSQVNIENHEVEVESLAQQLQQACLNIEALTKEKDNAVAKAQNSQAHIANVNQKVESLAQQLRQATSNIEILTQEERERCCPSPELSS